MAKMFETFISNNNLLLPFSSRRFANPNRNRRVITTSARKFRAPLRTIRVKGKEILVRQPGGATYTKYGPYCYNDLDEATIYGDEYMSVESFESYDESDLASEESLMKLYDRWLDFYKIYRSPEEKPIHFRVFKDTARHAVYHPSPYVGLGIHADMRSDLEGEERFKFDDNDLAHEENIWTLYERWIDFYGLSRTPEEKEQRFESFKKSAFFVQEHDKANKSFPYGLNGLADKTDEEWSVMCNSQIDMTDEERSRICNLSSVPEK